MAKFWKTRTGVVGAEDGDGGVEADLRRARGGGGKDHGGRLVNELRTVVLADAEGVKANLIGRARSLR